MQTRPFVSPPLDQPRRLDGFEARWSEQASGVVEGVSLVVRVPGGQLRVVPVEAIEDVAESERRVTFRPPVEQHGHRSLRRLEEGWRVEISLETPTMDADYWLGHCLGFLVNAPEAEVGVVDEVLYADSGEPRALLVRTSGWHGELVEVATADVVEIVPERRTLALERGLEGSPDGPGPVSAAWAAFERRWGGAP